MVAFVGGEGIEYIDVPMYIFSDIENSLPQHPSKIPTVYSTYLRFRTFFMFFIYVPGIYISIKNANLHFVATATISSSSFS